MFVVYIQRQQRDRYSCIDRVKTANLERTFESGDLLYGYIDRFNIVSIDKDMIISIDGMPGKYVKRHGTYTEITDNF
jgi:hypothetical protein